IQVLKTDTRVDVVFTDVQMPGSIDGFGLAQWVRRERPGMKIIITSGVKRASENAADLCEDGPLLVKPYAGWSHPRRGFSFTLRGVQFGRAGESVPYRAARFPYRAYTPYYVTSPRSEPSSGRGFPLSPPCASIEAMTDPEAMPTASRTNSVRYVTV